MHAVRKNSRLFIPEDKYTFTVNLPGLINESLFYKFKVLGWSSGQHTFNIYVNNNLLTTISNYGQGNFTKSSTISGIFNAGYNDIRIEYSNSNSNSQAYLDWFEIHYPREFKAIDNYLEFYLAPSFNEKKYSISNFTDSEIKNTVVYDEEHLSQFVSDKLITMDADEIEVTNLGKYFVRNIAAGFDPILKVNSKKFSRAL